MRSFITFNVLCHRENHEIMIFENLYKMSKRDIYENRSLNAVLLARSLARSRIRTNTRAIFCRNMDLNQSRKL